MPLLVAISLDNKVIFLLPLLRRPRPTRRLALRRQASTSPQLLSPPRPRPILPDATLAVVIPYRPWLPTVKAKAVALLLPRPSLDSRPRILTPSPPFRPLSVLGRPDPVEQLVARPLPRP